MRLIQKCVMPVTMLDNHASSPDSTNQQNKNEFTGYRCVQYRSRWAN